VGRYHWHRGLDWRRLPPLPAPFVRLADGRDRYGTYRMARCSRCHLSLRASGIGLHSRGAAHKATLR
jgi:hypothetical protein